jgi:chromosome segregation ATPase
MKHDLEETSSELKSYKSRSVEAAERAVEFEQKMSEAQANAAGAERTFTQLQRKVVELQEEEKAAVSKLRDIQNKWYCCYYNFFF